MNGSLRLRLSRLEVWDLDVASISTYHKITEVIGHPVIRVTGEKVNLRLINRSSFVRCNTSAPRLENLSGSKQVFAVLNLVSETPVRIDGRQGSDRSPTASFNWRALSGGFTVDRVLVN